jgi:signal transduction histidine kinase
VEYDGEAVSTQGLKLSKPVAVGLGGLLYFLVCRAGFMIVPVAEVVAVVWPASGVGFAVVWMLGPLGLVSVIVGDLASALVQGVGPQLALGFAGVNTVSAGLAVWLTRRIVKEAGLFDSAANVIVFGLVGAGVPSLMSAAFGTEILTASGIATSIDQGSVLATWFLSDVVGVLMVAPLLLVWLGPRDDAAMRTPLWQGAGLSAGVLALSMWVFLAEHPSVEGVYSSAFLFLPLMIISALKMGRRGLVLVVLMTGIIAYVGTAVGSGPFGGLGSGPGRLLQLLLVTMAWSTLLVHGLATELHRARAGLQIQVERQTADLVAANRQLRTEIAEREEAEKARSELEQRLVRAEQMEMIGTLAGGVAHDLNNILTGLLGYPDLLLMKLDKDSPLRRPVEVIRQSGQQAAAIVQDLLTLARRGVREEKVVSLNDLIRQYVAGVQHRELVDRHLEVAFALELEDDLLHVRGSAVHLEKVVANLVGNAFEACAGAGHVVVRTVNVTIESPVTGFEVIPDGDWVVISVQDDGVGMAPEEVRRIFEPFFSKKQLGRSGTGLGMAVVWGSVKDHGGHFDVESAPGGGTRVRVYLPACREALSESMATAVPATGGTETVLVVDDVEIQREIASEILVPLGYSVHAVASGEQALEWFRDGGEADLVVLDMIMDPGIDGLETYRRIVAEKPGQKALISSGFSETERVREALALGAGGYLKKPYTVAGLAQLVREVLDA